MLLPFVFLLCAEKLSGLAEVLLTPERAPLGMPPSTKTALAPRRRTQGFVSPIGLVKLMRSGLVGLRADYFRGPMRRPWGLEARGPHGL
jgi:hypothetical protein